MIIEAHGRNAAIPGSGWVLEIDIDGEPYSNVIRVDNERGYVDYIPRPLTIAGGQVATHRIFGKVHIWVTNRKLDHLRPFLVPSSAQDWSCLPYVT